MKLIVFCGSGKKDFPLELGRDLSVGRAADCDVVISERKASRKHCRLEWDGERLYVVDLGSSNGTIVSGSGVSGSGSSTSARLAPGTRHALMHNERIEIGEAAIIVDCPTWQEDIAPPIPAAPVQAVPRQAAPTAAAPTSSPAPAAPVRPTPPPARPTPTQAATTPSTPLAPAPVRQRRRSRRSLVGGLLSVAVVIALVAAGGIIFKDITSRQAARASLEQAQAVEAGGDLERALQLYARLREDHPRSEAAVEAHGRAVAIQTRIRRDEQARESLARFYAETEAHSLPAAEMSRQLEALISRHGDTAVGSSLRSLRDQVAQLALQERDLAFEQTIDAIRQDLEDGSYAHARVLLAEFASSYDAGPWKKRLTSTEIEIKQAARDGFENDLRAIDALIAASRYDDAIAYCDQRLGDYSGMPFDIELREKIAYVGAIRETFHIEVGSTAAAVVKEEVAQLREPLERLGDIDLAMLEGRFDEARAIIASVDRGKLPPEIGREFAWRDRGITAELELQAKLIAQINAGVLAKPSKAMRFGKADFTAIEADEERVWLALVSTEGSGKTFRKWPTFTDKERLAFYKVMDIEPVDQLGVAAFCFRRHIDELGEKGGPGQAALIKARKRAPELAAEITSFYAGVRGMQPPADGFHDYRKNFLLTREECRDQDLLTQAGKAMARLGKGYEDKVGSDPGRVALWDEIAGIREQAVATSRDRVVGKVNAMVTTEILPIRRKRAARLKELTELPAAVRQILVGLKEKLAEARKAALELIYDEAVYTYDKAKGDHGEKAQPDVDRLVDAVRDVWENPAGSAGEVNPAVRILTGQVREIDSQLVRFDPEVVQREIAILGEEFDIDYIETLANRRLDIKVFCQTTSERKAYQKAMQIMEDNATLPTVATDSMEKEQVRVLNEYRIMMGRMPLRICDQLVLAARGHSEYMASSGQFAHSIPGHPDGEHPGQRCAKQGYGGGVGENIAMGSGDPTGVHWQWYNSSGHHRNMLSAGWSVMGTGNSGAHWTQNFGSSACGAIKEQEAEPPSGN